MGPKPSQPIPDAVETESTPNTILPKRSAPFDNAKGLQWMLKEYGVEKRHASPAKLPSRLSSLTKELDSALEQYEVTPIDRARGSYVAKAVSSSSPKSEMLHTVNFPDDAQAKQVFLADTVEFSIRNGKEGWTQVDIGTGVKIIPTVTDRTLDLRRIRFNSEPTSDGRYEMKITVDFNNRGQAPHGSPEDHVDNLVTQTIYVSGDSLELYLAKKFLDLAKGDKTG